MSLFAFFFSDLCFHNFHFQIIPNFYFSDTIPLRFTFHLFIFLCGAKETFDLFHIQGRVDTFIFQKGTKGNTVIDNEYHVVTNISIDLNKHIPDFGHTIFEKLYKSGCYWRGESFLQYRNGIH